MSDTVKLIFIFIFVYIFISACATFIPVKKYQQTYFNTVKDAQNKPQERINRQLQYANYIEQHDGQLPPELIKTKLFLDSINKNTAPIKINAPKNTTTNEKNNKLKPKYIRDKNNPNILHPYRMRKFLFFRIYE